jgi:NADPH:quinone reductase-like Zn-dependent oxidoreductase
MELAGEVEAVGAAVSEFEVGDEVFGIKGGANAEYVCVREQGAMAHKPAGMSFEEAAVAGDGAIIALACLGKAQPLQGRSIVVYGASGSIGTAGVQLAKYFGAQVTAVCNGKNVGLVRSLGADVVIDYEGEDFTKNGKTYDVVFDSVGKHSFRRSRHSLKPGGIFIETDLGFGWHVPPLALLSRWIGDKRVTLPVPKYTKENVLLVKEAIEAGKYRPVVDRTYALEDVVESEGVARTRQAAGVSDLILLVSDGSQAPETEDLDEIYQSVDNKCLIVASKSDLPQAWSRQEAISVSAKTGLGIELLRRKIVEALDIDVAAERPEITNVRHIELVRRAHEALIRARSAALAEGRSLSEEFVLADLQEARAALEEITGKRSSDDVLTHIFERFCIGK